MFILNICRVKERRKSKGISQQILADKLCIEQPTYNKIETGKTQPNADLLFRLAQKLELNVIELMTEVSRSHISSPSVFEPSNIIDNQIETLDHISYENFTQLRSLLEQNIFLIKKLMANQGKIY